MAKYQYTVEGTDYDVEILEIEDNIAKVTVNGATFEVELKQMLNPTKRPIKQVVAPETTNNTRIETPKKPQAAAPAGGGANIEAPLPGTIVDIKVNVGVRLGYGKYHNKGQRWRQSEIWRYCCYSRGYEDAKQYRNRY